MCNIMMMQSRLQAFAEDPALKSTTAKPLLLPVLHIGGRKPELSSEKFVRSPGGVSFESEAFQLRTQAKIAELVRTASAETCSTNSLLAKKALKFRKVLGRSPFARAAAVHC